MTVEANPASTTVYIDDLDATYPTGTDVKSEGDNHLRLIKRVLLNTFPSVDAPVTATDSELNILDGVTASTAEINLLDGVTATTAELNILDGVTASAAELNLLDGRTSLGPTILTAQATTSGTQFDFSGIPTWAKRVTVMLTGVSSNGTSNYLVQLGTSGGLATSGYVSACQQYPTVVTSTAGILASGAMAASLALTGSVVLSLFSANTWQATVVTHSAAGNQQIGSGYVDLGGALDRLRLTTANGSDAFDAGAVNVMYE
jgi:hypothetical protein